MAANFSIPQSQFRRIELENHENEPMGMPGTWQGLHEPSPAQKSDAMAIDFPENSEEIADDFSENMENELASQKELCVLPGQNSPDLSLENFETASQGSENSREMQKEILLRKMQEIHCKFTTQTKILLRTPWG